MNEKIKYSDAELQEFKTLIEDKIESARIDLDLLRSSYMNDGNNGTEDTAPTFKAFEEGSETMSKEANTQKRLFLVPHATLSIEAKNMQK